MSRRKLATNALAATIQVIVNGIVLFELYRYVNRVLTVREIGVWSVVLSSATAGRLFDLGFGSGVVRFVAEFMGTEARSRAAMTVQIAFIGMATITTASCVLLYPLISHLLAHLITEPAAVSIARALLPYAFGTLIAGALSGVMLSALDGCQRMDLRVVISVTGALVQLLAAYWLLPGYGLKGLAIGQVLQSLVILLLAMALAHRQIGSSLLRPVRWERAVFIRLVRYGGGVQAAAIGQFLFEPVTKALLSRYGGLELTGYYEMANRMIVQLRSVVVSAYQALVPYVAGAGLQERQIQEVYRSSYGLLLSIAAPYFSLLGIGLPFLVIFWRGHFDANFLFAADACLFGWALNTLTTPAYFMFLGIGKTRWPVITHVSIGVLSALLGASIGHLFGGFAVLWTVAGVLGFGSFIVSYAFHREQGVDLRLLLPKQALVPVGVAVVTIVAITQVANRYANTNQYALVGVAVLLAAIVALVAWLNPERKLLLTVIRSLRPARAAALRGSPT
jgi:O-antigen/teichoic acid export membrane protein